MTPRRSSPRARRRCCSADASYSVTYEPTFAKSAGRDSSHVRRFVPSSLLFTPALLAAALPAAADFAECLSGIRADAARKGVSGTTFDAVMASVTPDPKVIESMESQPEFKTPIWDYLAFLVDEQRVNDGRQMMNRHGAALAAAERRYGVDRYAIAAVWGVESDYGQLAGKWYLPQALATLACTGPRRQDYFRSELLAT